MIQQIKPTLEEFLKIAEALKNQVSLDDSLLDGLEVALTKDIDASDFERALLYLEMRDLVPLIVAWRRRYIEKALECLEAGDKLKLYRIEEMPRLIRTDDLMMTKEQAE